MLTFFKKPETEKTIDKPVFAKGLILGLALAIVVVLVILGVVFQKTIRSWFGDSRSAEIGAVNTNPAKLKVTVIKADDCANCFDINQLIDSLVSNGIVEAVGGVKTLAVSDTKAQKLVEQYKLTMVPTFLFEGDLQKPMKDILPEVTDQEIATKTLAEALAPLGEIIDGVFVFRQTVPPYIDLATGNLRGEFELTYLTDQSCKECYDVTLHASALQNLGMTPKNTTTIDSSSAEGKALIEKYNITLVPTILFKGDIEPYQNLQQLWPTNGQVADDGTYIFTNLEAMGTHKNLKTNKVVEVEMDLAPEVVPQQ